MKIIGLTGGIGSGKTTVANQFKDLGVPLFIADVEAKRLMNTSKIIRRELIKLFGEKAYLDNALNKSFIAEKVFDDVKKLEALNAIVHPKVRRSFKNWVTKQTAPYVLYEAAIIFEQGRQADFDKTILVVADINERVQRLLERDNTTPKQIQNRMNHQWDDEKKIPLADYVIRNKTLRDTQQQVRKIHNSLMQS